MWGHPSVCGQAGTGAPSGLELESRGEGAPAPLREVGTRIFPARAPHQQCWGVAEGPISQTGKPVQGETPKGMMVLLCC